MTRRSVHFSMLYAGALFVGAFLGGALNMPRVHAKAPASAEADIAPEQAPAKEKPPVPCKITKDCPVNHVCTKVGDHKECTPTPIKPPLHPPAT